MGWKFGSVAKGKIQLMILVDTSAWIDFFVDSPARHVELLSKYIENGENIATCGIVITEVLQGIKKDTEYAKTRALFSSIIYLPMQHSTFIKSADIYRGLRKNGITIRKSLDCMIASLVIENDIYLLDNDHDFYYIEQYIGLKRINSR